MARDFQEEFRESMNALHFREDVKDRMHNKLLLSQRGSAERKEPIMKKWTFSRAAAAVAACVMITGITAFAASRIVFYTASSRADYEYKTASEMNHTDMPSVPEAFDNGFAFAGGNDVHVEGKDESGATAGKWTDLSVEYKNDSDQTITLSMTARPDAEETRKATETRTIEGLTVRFDRDEYLVLPDEDDELDANTKDRLEKDDHFFVSYGSEHAETVFYNGVSFEKDGILYHLYSADDISSDVLFGMAAELIR